MASPLKDISGKRFGDLTVGQINVIRGKNTYWLCKCDCGKQSWVRGNSLISGLTETCGHGSTRTQGRRLTGSKIGFLTLGERKTNKRGTVWYLCKCECGTEKWIAQKSIVHSGVVSCGCSKRSKLGNNAAGRVWYNYRKNALNRGLVWELDKQTFLRLVSEACHYCGASESNVSAAQWSTGEFKYNGIDRVDSSIGYTNENCVACCRQCNWAKRQLAVDQFEDWIRDAYWHFCVDKHLES